MTLPFQLGIAFSSEPNAWHKKVRICSRDSVELVSNEKGQHMLLNSRGELLPLFMGHESGEGDECS